MKSDLAFRKTFTVLLMMLVAAAGCDGGSSPAPGATSHSASVVGTASLSGTDVAGASGTASGTGRVDLNRAQPGSTIMSDAGNGRALIGPAGGTVELAGVGSVRFLPETFARPTSVTLSRAQDTEIAHTFSWMGPELGVRARAVHELRVVLGGEQPAIPVRVSLKVPQELRARASPGDEVRMLHLDVYDDPGVERFEHLAVSSERGKPSDDHVASWKEEFTFQPGPDGSMQGWFFLGLTRPNHTPPAAR